MERYCITVPHCPDIIWGNGVPKNIRGNGVLPRSPSTAPLVMDIALSQFLVLEFGTVYT